MISGPMWPISNIIFIWDDQAHHWQCSCWSAVTVSEGQRAPQGTWAVTGSCVLDAGGGRTSGREGLESAAKGSFCWAERGGGGVMLELLQPPPHWCE